MQLVLHVTTSNGNTFDASGDFDGAGQTFIEKLFQSWVNVQDETPGKLEALIGKLQTGREQLTTAIEGANQSVPLKKEKR